MIQKLSVYKILIFLSFTLHTWVQAAQVAVQQKTHPDLAQLVIYFTSAIAQEDVTKIRAIVKELAKGGITINDTIFPNTIFIDPTDELPYVQENKLTALHYAAHGGSVQVIRELHRLGADLDVQNENDVTPLMIAIDYGQVEAAIELVRLGADVSLADEINVTALDEVISAAWPRVDMQKVKKIVQALLQAGAKPSQYFLDKIKDTEIMALVQEYEKLNSEQEKVPEKGE